MSNRVSSDSRACEETVECGHCGERVDGRRGLISHHWQKHPELPRRSSRVPTMPGDSDCCGAVIGLTPATDRPYCTACGVILEGNRVDTDDCGPDRDDWAGQ